MTGLRYVKTTLVVAWKALKFAFVVLLVFAFSLFFREQRLPDFLVSRVTDSISTKEFLVRCDSAAFGFRHGFRLAGIRVYDLRRADSLERPVATARAVYVNFFAPSVRVVEAEYARMPDSYYEPEGPREAEPSPLALDVPELPEFRLVLERPSILGVKPERAVATVTAGEGRIVLDGSPREILSQAQRLHELQLTVPESTALILDLNRAGMCLPADRIDPESCAIAIAEALCPSLKQEP